MWTSLTLISITTAAAIAWQKRAQVIASAPAQRATSPRAPTTAARPGVSARAMLRLVADPSCPATRAFAGRMVPANEAVPLHVVGCRGDCRCHYEAVDDRRHEARRQHQDRRDALRFEPRGERRIASDRRSAALWETRLRF